MERPVLFNGPMVREILADRKTQTRRIISCACNNMHLGKLLGDWGLSVPPHPWDGEERLWRFQSRTGPQVGDWIESVQTAVDDYVMAAVRCPFGQPGDRLWVREAFMHQPAEYEPMVSCSIPIVRAHTTYRADFDGDSTGAGWSPSIHMPRHLSRIDLEVTGIRVERLQDISEEDAKAEGVRPFFERFPCCGRDQRLTSGDLAADAPYRASFAVLWDEIYGGRGLFWKSNPWVFVITFRRIS